MQISARTGSSSEESRARILTAAKAIYEQNGTRGTTTREVAERAGVNEATLFRHFGNKQALLAAMREGACPVAVFESVLASLTGDLPSSDGMFMRLGPVITPSGHADTYRYKSSSRSRLRSCCPSNGPAPVSGERRCVPSACVSLHRRW